MTRVKKVIYCDMDGVLADFNKEPNAVERFATEKGFFYKLEPIADNVKALEYLSRYYTIYILSASPNAKADKDKIKWLKKYAPFIKKENIILCRNGEKKVDFMVTDLGILLDDYGKNCREWCEKRGNISYKITKENSIAYYSGTITMIA